MAPPRLIMQDYRINIGRLTVNPHYVQSVEQVTSQACINTSWIPHQHPQLNIGGLL
jgi:hypothetical protein